MNRWGFPQGQGRLVGAQLAELPIPKALAAVLNGTLSTAAAAEQAQADLETIARRSSRGAELRVRRTARRSTRGGDAVGACTHVVVATTLEDAWRMSQGTTTVISGPQRSLPIWGVTSANGVTSVA